MIKIRSKYYSDFTPEEIEAGFNFMLYDEIYACGNISYGHPLLALFLSAWHDFESGKFSIDGATFMRERSELLFEVRSFIHDWRNESGFVGYAVDAEMICIMKLLNYSQKSIRITYILTRFTPLNVLRHKIRRTYVGSFPENLFLQTKNYLL